MRTDDFDYILPEELIAQTPLKVRSNSRLLVTNRTSLELKHDRFSNISEYLKKGDVLVLNNTKVIPARLYGVKEGTFANIEILLLNQFGLDLWEALVKPAKRVKVGTRVVFGEGLLTLECTEELEDGIRHFKLDYVGVLETILDQLGERPLPP